MRSLNLALVSLVLLCSPHRMAPKKKSALNSADGVRVVEDKKLCLFYHGIFSQWHMCKFEADDFVTASNKDTSFSSAEQYMMAAKAHLFKDEEVGWLWVATGDMLLSAPSCVQSLGLIMKTADPRTVKALGRAVKNFDEKTWNANCVVRAPLFLCFEGMSRVLTLIPALAPTRTGAGDAW